MPCIITERSTGEELACKRFYSFYMFAKKFDIKNIGARNQGPTFTEWYKRYQHVFQQNHLKWLDQELKVREGSAIFSYEQ